MKPKDSLKKRIIGPLIDLLEEVIDILAYWLIS
jgi:hypothetical protein